MFRQFTRLPNEERGIPLADLKPGQLFVFHENTSDTQVYIVLSDAMRPMGTDSIAIASLIGGKVVFQNDKPNVFPVEARVEWFIKK